MKLPLLLPLLALPLIAAADASAPKPDSLTKLRRDFATVQQQRDTLTEQLLQLQGEYEKLQAERDRLKAEQDSVKSTLTAAQTSAIEASEAVRAQKDAEMTVDMTVRAYALKEQEAQDALKAAKAAAELQRAAEQARDDALADTQRAQELVQQAHAERDAARQSEAAAHAAKAAMQNELYAAQIRIENLSRALTARTSLPSAVLAPAPEPEAPEPQPTPTPQAATSVRTHTVAEGESLSLISFKYYQSPNQWERIVAANRAKLRNPDQLRPGMVLIIP